ncbi:hypothetical protein KCU65_g48, partial [Aureobasidium melanogenum]
MTVGALRYQLFFKFVAVILFLGFYEQAARVGCNEPERDMLALRAETVLADRRWMLARRSCASQRKRANSSSVRFWRLDFFGVPELARAIGVDESDACVDGFLLAVVDSAGKDMVDSGRTLKVKSRLNSSPNLRTESYFMDSARSKSSRPRSCCRAQAGYRNILLTGNFGYSPLAVLNRSSLGHSALVGFSLLVLLLCSFPVFFFCCKNVSSSDPQLYQVDGIHKVTIINLADPDNRKLQFVIPGAQSAAPSFIAWSGSGCDAWADSEMASLSTALMSSSCGVVELVMPSIWSQNRPVLVSSRFLSGQHAIRALQELKHWAVSIELRLVRGCDMPVMSSLDSYIVEQVALKYSIQTMAPPEI